MCCDSNYNTYRFIIIGIMQYDFLLIVRNLFIREIEFYYIDQYKNFVYNFSSSMKQLEY